MTRFGVSSSMKEFLMESVVPNDDPDHFIYILGFFYAVTLFDKAYLFYVLFYSFLVFSLFYFVLPNDFFNAEFNS